MFEGMRSTCRDMARFGKLFLNRGQWGAKRIVVVEVGCRGDREVVAEAERGVRLPVVGEPQGDDRRPARRDEHQRRGRTGTRKQGRIGPDAPHDMFWALGLGNQVIQVDPGSKTVVVRLGTAEAQPKPPTFGRGRQPRRHRGRPSHEMRTCSNSVGNRVRSNPQVQNCPRGMGASPDRR